MARKISIHPNTRLEGHGKVEIILDDAGNVIDVYFQVIEFRGFEKFCEGRHVEELPRITPKICGVCPGAHHMASTKACDAVYGASPPPAARMLREIYYNAHMAHSHILHFFALGAPDLLLMDEGAARRNIFGLVEKLGKEVGAAVVDARGYAQRIQGIIGGHPIYPVTGLPGGLAKPLLPEERAEIVELARALVTFSQKSLEIFARAVLQNRQLAALIAGDLYRHETYYAGLVDEKKRVNFYEGRIRVVDPEGREVALFEGQDYLQEIAEHVEPWSYIKFPYLKKIGWQGFTDGPASGIYRVNALARLNVAEGMATPLAQEAYERFFAFFGRKPVHHTLAYHWARLVELMYASERILELAQDPEITDPHVRAVPDRPPAEGVGVVEAPRGTLYHHYVTDKKGIVQKVNLIVATVQNNAAINLAVKKAAQGLIKNGAVDEKVLNMVEMAVRAYDPCLACASHMLPGRVPLEVLIYQGGKLRQRILPGVKTA
ncbi:F420-non-reducing hydrogenase large subunit [Thermodesulfitimonas autotrophica]|uniref:F420-non-reducing hydrogenase large subunit n=1 Tax=Thermodesulfitimonas autotrophica TaxID=1894989 RepID=A0A3N5AXS9_9THEO|nr:Ni/Fe hydrogenase subunit alpha [Thermodesulfitimonas autotrophica]RPF49819.1 F420-non-reducing hydrogenase large subunit [Thermodesulfitimonas autotrophica]